ncbi:hypothetical protein [Nocardia sp. CY41]|nr:hypothetical protein [Nocardia sp. CY41]
MTSNQPHFPDGAQVDRTGVRRIADSRGRADADQPESRRRFS